MLLAKQSTAATLIIGPILDSTGAEYTSAVIGDISLSKNGATLTALASAATLTHIANGQYTLVLTTGNTDTLGRAQFTCNKSTYQMPPLELMILPATVFDALVTNATNTTGGLATATGTVSALAGYLGATGAAINGTNVNTLSSHDPGATLGTSTLTQTQVTGGAYALNSASFAFNAALDFTTTQKAATIARVTLTDTVTTVTNQLTGAAIATAVWTDTTASDFTTALSVGKSVMNGVTLGTGLTVARCTLTDTLTTYTGDTPQTGDSFARIGATGSGLTSLAPSATALSTAVWTAPPTGFLAATFPTTIASTTNITGGTITTVTNLTNAPTAGDFTATMKTSLNAATPAVTVSDKTGFSLASSQSFNNTGQSANLPSNMTAIRGTSLTETSSGYLANAFMTVFNVPTAYFTAAQVFPPNFSYLEITAVSGHVSVQDVAGRVLGGGSSAFTGVGVLAQNESGAAIPTAAQNAAATIGYNMGNGRTVAQALYALRNKVAIVGSTLTVMSTDDVTPSWVATVTEDAASNPITAIDPVG